MFSMPESLREPGKIRTGTILHEVGVIILKADYVK